MNRKYASLRMKRIVCIVILLFFYCKLSAQKDSQQWHIDSLIRELQHSVNDTIKVDLLNKLTTVSQETVNPDIKRLAAAYADSALKLAKRISYRKGLANALLNKGKYEISNGNKFAEGTTDLLEAQFNFEKINDSLGIAKCYLQLGVVSYILLYYEDAIKNLEHCILYANSSPALKATATYLIAISNSALKKTGEAKKYFAITLKEYTRIGNKHGLKECYIYMGKMYVDNGDLDSAFHFLNLSLLVDSAEDDSSNLNRPYSFLSTAFLKKNDIPNAIEYALISYRAGKKANDKITMLESLNTLSQSYFIKGDYKNAYLYLNELKELKDSIFSISVAQRVAESKSKFVFDKELNDQKLKQEKEEAIAKEQLQKQKILKYSFISGICLLVILLLVISNRARLKQKSALQLASTYETLKATQQQLIQQEKLASLGGLTAGIAHEIKNPLNFITNFSDLSIELIAEIKTAANEEERNEILGDLGNNLNKISEHGKRADSIVKSMLQHSRSGLGNKQLTDLNKLCDEFVGLAYHGMRAKDSGFNTDILKSFDPALPKVNVITQDFSRVLLNLTANAFYAVKKRSENQPEATGIKYLPKVSISTVLQRGQVVITIRDNGTGIPAGMKEKIFEPFFTTKPSGEGTGLGLSICNDIIEGHGGKIKVDSKENEFTEFVISIPV